MIPSSVAYHKPSSVSEAAALLNKLGDDAKLLAGGHSLIPVLKLRLNSPEHLIDISQIPELKAIGESDGQLVIGASVTHNEIAQSDYVQSHCPLLSEAAAMIGDIQVRNFGTIGGSIAHADPAADWPGVLLAANASIILQSETENKIVPATDFFMGLFMTKKADNEIVTHIMVPKSTGKSTYHKFAQPASRFAIVGCAIDVNTEGGQVRNAAVAFNGVSATPFRDNAVEEALKGKVLNVDNIEAAAALAAESVSIMSDHYASQKYRKHLAKVYAKRALMSLL